MSAWVGLYYDGGHLGSQEIIRVDGTLSCFVVRKRGSMKIDWGQHPPRWSLWGCPTCSYGSSVLLAQRGPLAEWPVLSLIGPRSPASYSGRVWPRAFKRGFPLVQCVPDTSSRRVHLDLFECSVFGVLSARAPRGIWSSHWGTILGWLSGASPP